MGFKTYREVVQEHLSFLQTQGLDVEELQVDVDFIRCRAIGITQGRGELSYKTVTSAMDNGLVGLATWCRGVNGMKDFQSYGFPRGEHENIVRAARSMIPVMTEKPQQKDYEEGARKALFFWEGSSLVGKSDYLIRKNVGDYGLRFRYSEEYGKTAIVPMVDAAGRFLSCQMLNRDGKRFFPGTSTIGLFHVLRPVLEWVPLGIAEGYATAACLLELVKIPMVCAFSSSNLVEVARIMREKHPFNRIVIFADNDRHLQENLGVLKAREALDSIAGPKILAVPDFKEHEPSKEASDWCDLVRLKGTDEAIRQLKAYGWNP